MLELVEQGDLVQALAEYLKREISLHILTFKKGIMAELELLAKAEQEEEFMVQ
jgi:hypothetical protein